MTFPKNMNISLGGCVVENRPSVALGAETALRSDPCIAIDRRVPEMKPKTPFPPGCGDGAQSDVSKLLSIELVPRLSVIEMDKRETCAATKLEL